MGFGLLFTVSLILIIGAGMGMLTNLGWVPWAVCVALVALAFVGQGLVARRRRGTQTPLSSEPDTVDGRRVVLGHAEDEGAPPVQ